MRSPAARPWSFVSDVCSAQCHVAFCRYRGAYENYARALRSEFPRIKLRGDVFHPGDLRVMLAQLLQMGFFGGIVTALVGKHFLPAAISDFMSDNPMLTSGAGFVRGC